MTISHMAMNVGHQVFLNNCWGLECTIGKTNISSLNTPSQQLHSGVKVIRRSRCKQKNRVEKYLWSVPLRKRLRCWPNHPLLAERCNYCSAHFVWPLPCLWAVKIPIDWTLALYVAGKSKPSYDLYKTGGISSVICHKLSANMWIHHVTTSFPAVPQGTVSHCDLSLSSSES